MSNGEYQHEDLAGCQLVYMKSCRENKGDVIFFYSPCVLFHFKRIGVGFGIQLICTKNIIRAKLEVDTKTLK